MIIMSETCPERFMDVIFLVPSTVKDSRQDKMENCKFLHFDCHVLISLLSVSLAHNDFWIFRYAKHVAESLSHGLSFPSVKFIGQKVLAIFDGKGKKIGPISEGVYRAVKKRQIRENIEFKLLW